MAPREIGREDCRVRRETSPRVAFAVHHQAENDDHRQIDLLADRGEPVAERAGQRPWPAAQAKRPCHGDHGPARARQAGHVVARHEGGRHVEVRQARHQRDRPDEPEHGSREQSQQPVVAEGRQCGQRESGGPEPLPVHAEDGQVQRIEQVQHGREARARSNPQYFGIEQVLDDPVPGRVVQKRSVVGRPPERKGRRQRDEDGARDQRDAPKVCPSPVRRRPGCIGRAGRHRARGHRRSIASGAGHARGHAGRRR